MPSSGLLGCSRSLLRLRPRPGVALAAALLLLVVLDCIILGTLHLSLQEHRIGSNRQSILQLRLDAESALRAALGSWTPAQDSLAVGTAMALPAPGIGHTSVSAERLGEHLYLLQAIAVELPPRTGRAAARLLVKPPPLPPDVDAAPAALSVRGSIHILETGSVSIAAADCDRTPPQYSILAADPMTLLVEPGGLLDAAPGPLGERSLTDLLDRLTTLSAPGPALRLIAGDTVVAETAAGVWIVEGSLTLAAGALFNGLLVVHGDLALQPGAAIGGAAHVGGSAEVGGELRSDPCLVDTTIAAARLEEAQPAGRRAWIPAF